MDDTPAKPTPGDNFNKLDLSAFEAFQFGTQWTTDKEPPREGGGSDRPRRFSGEGGPPRRDRRPPRREDDRGPRERPAGGPDEGGARPERGPRRDFGGPRRDFGGPRRDDRDGGPRGPGGGGHFERGPRRFDRGEDRGGEGPRGGGREGGYGPRRPAGPPRPYISPVFELTFYPDDTGFNALVKAMRASCRTYELFEIARLILGKLERCVVVYKRRPDEAGKTPPLFISVPDGVPFESEEEAINHALEHSLDKFFVTEEVEVEPPKGAFQFVNRCPITKALLGPPNYHRYAQMVQQHYNAHAIRMPFDRYKASIEVVRDPEAVAAWLESMKKVTRYTYRGEMPGEITIFDTLEDARNFLLRTCRDRLVRSSDSARLAAKVVEDAGRTEAARAMHGALDMQRRFPLDTANALRGRIRRENFHIFKRGSKGVTYVCSVRRRFRQPGQVFSDTINRLIEFLDTNPMVNVAELPLRFLGFEPPAAAPAAAPAAPAPAPEPVESTPASAEEPAGEAPTAAAEPAAPAEAAPAEQAAPAPEPVAELTFEQRAALNRLMLDLRWLVSEGYVAEYSDGRLSAHPEMTPDAPAPDAKEAEGTGAEGSADVEPTSEADVSPADEPSADAQPEPEEPKPEAGA